MLRGQQSLRLPAVAQAGTGAVACGSGGARAVGRRGPGRVRRRVLGFRARDRRAREGALRGRERAALRGREGDVGRAARVRFLAREAVRGNGSVRGCVPRRRNWGGGRGGRMGAGRSGVGRLPSSARTRWARYGPASQARRGSGSRRGKLRPRVAGRRSASCAARSRRRWRSSRVAVWRGRRRSSPISAIFFCGRR